MSLAVRVRLGALVMVLSLGPTACTSSSDDSNAAEAAELPSPSTSTQDPASDATQPTGVRIAVTDPGLVVTLPHGWHKDSLQTYRAQVIAAMRGAPPAYREVFRKLLHTLKSGIIVGQATGPVDSVNYTPNLAVTVETGDASVAAAANRRLHVLMENSFPGVPRTVVSRRLVTLPVGRAIRVITHTPPPPGTNGVPSQSVEYVMLIDGSTISIGGTAPTADHEFVGVVDGIASTVTRS